MNACSHVSVPKKSNLPTYRRCSTDFCAASLRSCLVAVLVVTEQRVSGGGEGDPEDLLHHARALLEAQQRLQSRRQGAVRRPQVR